MKKYYKVNEVAALFNVPVATLHYWEKEGLFQVKRNQDNDYRMFDLGDILNLWEIVLYRELNIPVKQIGQVMHSNLISIDQIYDESQDRLQQQISELERQMRCIERQKRLIQVAFKLEQSPLVKERPDFKCCYEDAYTMETIRVTLEDPYRSCMRVTGTEKKTYTRGIILTQEQEKNQEKKQLLWKADTSEYIQFLMKANIEDSSDNNISQIEAAVREMGYEPGMVIARYLMIAAEGDKRLEYYCAWMQIKERP